MLLFLHPFLFFFLGILEKDQASPACRLWLSLLPSLWHPFSMEMYLFHSRGWIIYSQQVLQLCTTWHEPNLFPEIRTYRHLLSQSHLDMCLASESDLCPISCSKCYYLPCALPLSPSSVPGLRSASLNSEAEDFSLSIAFHLARNFELLLSCSVTIWKINTHIYYIGNNDYAHLMNHNLNMHKIWYILCTQVMFSDYIWKNT